MSDWRQNPNLVECFENCVAMLRDRIARPTPPLSTREQWAAEIKARRLALGLSQHQLGEAIGCREGPIGDFERVYSTSAERYRQLSAALDRLEAESRS